MHLMRVPAIGGPVENVVLLHAEGSGNNHFFDVLPAQDAAVVQFRREVQILVEYGMHDPFCLDEI